MATFWKKIVKPADPEERYLKLKAQNRRAGGVDTYRFSTENKNLQKHFSPHYNWTRFQHLKRIFKQTKLKLRDANSDNVYSSPYNIIEEERCGRLLLAARDISAGEILFRDTPGAIGPDNNTEPICLTCYRRLPGLVYRCHHCGVPLCGPKCQQDDGPHARECQLFRSKDIRLVVSCDLGPLNPYRSLLVFFRFDKEDAGLFGDMSDAIMALRILWLRDNEPRTWEKLDIFMDHIEDISKEEEGAFFKIVEFIYTRCQLTQFSKSDILHVLGN